MSNGLLFYAAGSCSIASKGANRQLGMMVVETITA